MPGKMRADGFFDSHQLSSVEFSTKRRNMERCSAQIASPGSREGLKVSSLLISNDYVSEETKLISKTALIKIEPRSDLVMVSAFALLSFNVE